jgi:hypothetical protein
VSMALRGTADSRLPHLPGKTRGLPRLGVF